jgi:sorbose reductase
LLWDLDTWSEEAKSGIATLQSDFEDRTIHSIPVDVSNEFNVQDAVAHAAGNFGRIDHLLCFAGVVGCVPFLDMSLEEFRRVMKVNQDGAFLCAREVGRYVACVMDGIDVN